MLGREHFNTFAEYAAWKTGLFLRATELLEDELIKERSKEEFVWTVDGEKPVTVDGFVIGKSSFVHAQPQQNFPGGWLIYPIEAKHVSPTVTIQWGELATFQECGDRMPREGDIFMIKRAESLGRINVRLIGVPD